MASFQFGARTEKGNFQGGLKQVGEWALHVQCCWRIVRGDSVVVGSGDLYYPADYTDGDSVPDDFLWDSHPNRLDDRLRSLFRTGSREVIVRRTELTEAGACTIEFDDGLRLEVFPSNSLATEHWRLLSPSDAAVEHIVVAGDESGVP